MKWLDSALYPFKHRQHMDMLLHPCIMLFGFSIYVTMVSGGFLFLVGIHKYSLLAAAVPVLAASLFTACLSAGYFWEILSCLEDNVPIEHRPIGSHWMQVAYEGSHLLFFYTLLASFLISLTILFYPFGLIIPVLVLLFHPLLLMPPLFSCHDRTFLGLLDGCLDTVKVLKSKEYALILLNGSLYLVLISTLSYIPTMLIFTASGIGVFGVPGLAFANVLGYCHLLKTLGCQHHMTTPAALNSFFPNAHSYSYHLYLSAEAASPSSTSTGRQTSLHPHTNPHRSSHPPRNR